MPMLAGTSLSLSDKIFNGCLSAVIERSSAVRPRIIVPFLVETVRLRMIGSLLCGTAALENGQKQIRPIKRSIRTLTMRFLIGADHLADTTLLFLGHLRGCLLRVAPVVKNADLVYAL